MVTPGGLIRMSFRAVSVKDRGTVGAELQWEVGKESNGRTRSG